MCARARAGEANECLKSLYKVQDTMDTKAEGSKKKGKGRWEWLPGAMPGVARLMAEKRRALGDAHVAECWRRSMAGEPGWFFAREGAIAVGTPWAHPDLANFAALQVTATQAMLIIKGAGDGTH